MPELDLLTLLADAYQGGQVTGRSIHWIVLIGFGVVLVRRLVRGSFGPASAARRPAPSSGSSW